MYKLRHVSGPALKLLEMADLPLAEIDAALEALVGSKPGGLRVNQPLLQRAARAASPSGRSANGRATR